MPTKYCSPHLPSNHSCRTARVLEISPSREYTRTASLDKFFLDSLLPILQAPILAIPSWMSSPLWLFERGPFLLMTSAPSLTSIPTSWDASSLDPQRSYSMSTIMATFIFLRLPSSHSSWMLLARVTFSFATKSPTLSSFGALLATHLSPLWTLPLHHRQQRGELVIRTFKLDLTMML